MSTIRVNSIQHTTANSGNMMLHANGNVSMLTANSTLFIGNTSISNAGISVSGSAVSPFGGMRNRLINGAMVIDQRNAGASVSFTTGGQYFVDRWCASGSASGKASMQQSSVAPTGFTNSLLITSSSAWSLGVSDYATLNQYIEGYNVADLGWGTANAKTITLSFWVRSSLTGTFSGAINNQINAASPTRSYAFSFTISSANTWEQKTVTIPGDTTGTWGTTSSGGISVIFSLGAGANYLTATPNTWISDNAKGVTGQTNLLASNGATWYITGVQLEVGTIATPFERRPYGTELALCQRYFCKSYDIDTAVGTATRTGYVNWNWGNMMSNATVYLTWPVRMRASPTVTNYNPDLTSTVGGRYWNGTAEVAFTGSLSGWAAYQSGAIFNMDATSRSNMLFQWTAEIEI